MNRSENSANSELNVVSRTFRKTRRKRRRTKQRTISTAKLSRKCQKKFCTTTAASGKSCFECNSFKIRKKNKDYESCIELNRNKIMSSWYWSNYNKALAWRNKHKLAHWKAYALTLQQENQYLLQVIRDLDPWKVAKTSNINVDLVDTAVKQDLEPAFQTERIENDLSTSNVCGDDELAFELSEEMMKFFEQSFKHKMDLKKAKEAEKINDEDAFLKETQKLRVQREEEMKLLYGEGASMIVGMETAVQLSYDRYCDTKSPKYWPNIPLKL